MGNTVRIYLCKSLDGDETIIVRDYFTIGKHYEETDVDHAGFKNNDDTSLLLKDNDGEGLYVNKEDFELTHVRQRVFLN